MAWMKRPQAECSTGDGEQVRTAYRELIAQGKELDLNIPLATAG